ncbi:MAG: hypothetical protein LBT94_02515 [Prevotellaceae bacterium]|jgi:hypothetical protein|nr:hypothetical protein [Prevotellaceae bacterium]
MKTQKQLMATLAAALWLGVTVTSCCKSGSGSSAGEDENGTHEDRAVGVPTELKHEYNQQKEVTFFWKSAANADFYQLKVNEKSYNVTGTYFKLPDKLSNTTECPWYVRAARKLTADTAYSDWATATLPPLASEPEVTLPMKFVGTWLTDSTDVSAKLGSSTLPVDSFMPSNVDASLLAITVAENENSEDSVFVSIVGLEAFLSMEDQELNRISMGSSKSKGTISGEIPIDPARNKVSHNFNPPVPLSELGMTMPEPSIDPAIQSLTVTFTKITVSGKLDDEEATKAQYEIKVIATISVDTGDATINWLANDMYLKNNPMNVILKAYCRKQESD